MHYKKRLRNEALADITNDEFTTPRQEKRVKHTPPPIITDAPRIPGAGDVPDLEDVTDLDSELENGGYNIPSPPQIIRRLPNLAVFLAGGDDSDSDEEEYSSESDSDARTEYSNDSDEEDEYVTPPRGFNFVPRDRILHVLDQIHAGEDVQQEAQQPNPPIVHHFGAVQRRLNFGSPAGHTPPHLLPNTPDASPPSPIRQPRFRRGR